MPFARAAELCTAGLRVTVSKETAHRLELAAGQALVAAEEAATAHLFASLPEPAAPAVAHQQLSIDGAFVPLIGGEWGEVKTLAIATILAGDNGPRATGLSYYSRLADHERFSQSATIETHRRATGKAGQVTAVCDGADWIQGAIDLLCPQATRVLDWAHASSYVSRAAQALFADPGMAADWRSSQLNALMLGDPEDVLVALCEGLTRCPLGSEEETVVVASLGYLARHYEQIHYREYREAGLPIGSGIVESGNNVVVGVRLKGAGMRWARANVDPMLALRNTICSNRWDQTWSLLERYRLRRAAELAIEQHDRKHTPPPPPRTRRTPRRPRPFRDFSLRSSRRRAKS